MNKVDTSDIAAGVAYPPSKKGFDFLQDAHIEIFSAIAQGLCGDPTGANAWVLWGCGKQDIGGGNFQFFSGYIYDEVTNEVYHFPGIASIAIATAPVLTITTTPDPTADPTTFSDGSSKNVHDVRTLVVSDGALGSADINYEDLIFINPAAYGENWHEVGTTGEPAYSNSYSGQSLNLGDNLAFLRDGKTNTVKFKGAFGRTPESAGVTVFTLPTGYRPANNINIPIVALNNNVWIPAVLRVSTAGIVTVSHNAGDLTTLMLFTTDGVSFPLY